ncbi:VOC family protein [Streptomyces sp. NPDC056600]|uniref:VOC family protein n=1 Tax=Streptomyces sp. NPDC056600 TaxID=3345874 RepID=UPI003675CCE6
MDSNGFTTCLWFDNQAEEAAEYYVSVFPDSRIERVDRFSEAGPEKVTPDENGSVVEVQFTVNGQRFSALDGGPLFHFDEAISFQIMCDSQEEADRYWNTLIGDGGQESQCGWLKDKYGLSWQVIPKEALELMRDPDRAKAARAMAAMLTMRRLDVAEMRTAAEAG